MSNIDQHRTVAEFFAETAEDGRAIIRRRVISGEPLFWVAADVGTGRYWVCDDLIAPGTRAHYGYLEQVDGETPIGDVVRAWARHCYAVRRELYQRDRRGLRGLTDLAEAIRVA